MQPPYYKEIQKQHLLPVTTQEQGLNKSRSAGYSGGLFRGDTFWPVLSICAILYLTLFPLHASVEPDINATCPVQHTVAPGPSEALDAKLAELQSASYFNQSLTYWQHAIQVETQSFDEQGSVKDDPQRYVHLAKFEAMLKREFGETVFKKLHFEKVNTYGFLFTWPGSDESLKPAVYVCPFRFRLGCLKLTRPVKRRWAITTLFLLAMQRLGHIIHSPVSMMERWFGVEDPSMTKMLSWPSWKAFTHLFKRDSSPGAPCFYLLDLTKNS